MAPTTDAMMIDLDEASRRWQSVITTVEVEQIALAEALGRVLRDPLRSRWPLPVHDHAAMDGYGVRAADVSLAVPAGPVALEVIGVVTPGQTFAKELGVHEAVRIFTGAAIPTRVDCVIRQEDVERHEQRILVSAPVPIGHNIRRRGEDVDAGVLLVDAGTVIDPDVVMALASFGCDPVCVSRQPRVAVVTCGDELVPAACATPTHVVDIAGPTIAACCRQFGAETLCFGPALDELDSLRKTVEQARACAPDLLITIGGASVGDHDLVARVLDSLGMRWAFSRVRVKPGKPTGFGMLDAMPVFVLPGNPGAAKVMFGQLVGPALAAMRGQGPATALERRSAVVSVPLARDHKRATVLQLRVSEAAGRLQVDNQHLLSSARITPTLHANASVVVPAGAEPLPAGSVVDVDLRRPPRRRASPPVLAFIGSSGSGKTTVLTGLIAALSVDLQIGVIKHGRHFDFDKPGKDSDRFRAAGAAVIIMASPDLTATVERPEHPPSFAELLLRLPERLDLILVEGFKYEGLRSIEVHHGDRPMFCRSQGFEHVIAVITDTPSLAPPGMPCYRHDQFTELETLARALASAAL